MDQQIVDLAEQTVYLSETLEQIQESLEGLSGVSLLEADTGDSAGTATYIGIAAVTFAVTYAGLFVTTKCCKGSRGSQCEPLLGNSSD